MKSGLFVLMTLSIFLPSSMAADRVAVPSASVVSAEKQVNALALPLAKKKWTIIVFMNGKNSLSEFGAADLREMQDVGSGADYNVVAELGMVDHERDGMYPPVKRFYITPRVGRKAFALELSSSDKADMGDWKEAVDFIKYAKKNFPAEKYMLVLWGHGYGWIGNKPSDVISDEPLARAMSPDMQTDNYFSTMELRQMLKETGGVDVLAFDACLMADIAVYSEISKHVPYIVGSEEYAPETGYNYTDLLNRFAAKPDMDARQVSIAVADSYKTQHKNTTDNLTVSAVDSAQIPQFAKYVKEFVRIALKSSDTGALLGAYRSVARFQCAGAMHDADLYDFMRITAAGTKDSELKAAAETAMKFMREKVVIYNAAYNGHSGRAFGLAGYLPMSRKDYFSGYENLMFGKYTGWGELVTHLMSAEPIKPGN